MSPKKKTRFIFITGGVVSSLGKGLTASSIGALLQARGFKICLRKLDPYLNIDPGTMSPMQHGEVFVTEDGGETDLDLGNYERFTGTKSSKNDNITTGKIYYNLLKKERKGDYLGQTVQVIPHVIDIIKSFIFSHTTDIDFVICEIGGTVGDIESQPFLETIRQIGYNLTKTHTIFIHLTLVPYVAAAKELKTKPTQHSVKELNSLGVQPDIILCRSDKKLSIDQCNKIANFCNVLPNNVIPATDVRNIYELPVTYYNYGLDKQILTHFNIVSKEPDLTKWYRLLDSIENAKEEITIAIVGKYIGLHDSYKSLVESLNHAGIYHKVSIKIQWIDSRFIKDPNCLKDVLSNVNGILIPGGFGDNGIEGKVLTIKYARENNIPCFCICLGMQLAVIEYARNVLGIEEAGSTEFNRSCKNPIVDLMKDYTKLKDDDGTNVIGGSMRVGSYQCFLKKNTLIASIYKQNIIKERRRHRYGINLNYTDVLNTGNMVFSGYSEDEDLVESIEIRNHPWFLGVQFHPEFNSSPFLPHPLFKSFIETSMKHKR